MTEMRRGGHLDDEQFVAVLEGAASETVATHVAKCVACREEVAWLSGAAWRLAAWSRKTAAQSAGFWYAQRQVIAEQAAGRREPSRLPAWSAAMAAVVLAALLLAQVSAPDAQTLRARAAQGSGAEPAAIDPDDALLAEIEASLQLPVPRPLQPALLVAQELSRAAEQAESQP